MAPEYFFKLFNQNSYINVFPKLIVGKHLTVDAQSWLTRSVTMEEIKTVVFKMHPDKSPGPDVFNPYFYQRNWEVISPDLCKAVLFFFQKGRLLKEVNHTFVSLIPKSTNASQLSDFRQYLVLVVICSTKSLQRS